MDTPAPTDLEKATEHLKSMACHYDDDTMDEELFEAAIAYADLVRPT